MGASMRCPICNNPVEQPREGEAPAAPSSTRYFPFCSERCKLIDLGRWLGGRYQIPADDDEDAADVPPERG